MAYVDKGQPCSACAGEHPYCPERQAAVEEFERTRWGDYSLVEGKAAPL